MKKLFTAAVAGVGLSAAVASAQIGPASHEMRVPAAGGCAAPGGDCGTGGCADGSCGKFGMNPLLKKLMWWKKDECSTGKCKKACVPPPPGAIGGPPVGTLVFPVNPYTRSPRDFFMYGQGGY